MRVTKIEVIKLFGVFNHSIALKLEDRITIIHGPNGYGKTAILMMVRAAIENKFGYLRRAKFERFALSFDNGGVLSVTRSERKSSEKGSDRDRSVIGLHFEMLMPGEEKKEFSPDTVLDAREISFPIEVIDRHIEELSRIGPNSWRHIPSGRVLDLDDVADEYGDVLPIRQRAQKKLPSWLTNLPKTIDVRLIEAQRLLSVLSDRRAHRPEMAVTFEPSVLAYSKELAANIQEIQARYGTSSQQLDSTFPTRAIQSQMNESLSDEELKNKLRELEQNRQRIIAAGLLAAEGYSPLFDPKQAIDTSTKRVLALYSADIEKKLSVFSEVTGKIELFKELVNKRFSYKQLDIEGQNGFRLHSTNGGTLLPSDLSSGEQHELVLLYELLFKTKQNAVILIDEPELSLHVAWQVEFLKDLARVIKLSSFDVILATHSPQIINDRWDLAVELQGPAQ